MSKNKIITLYTLKKKVTAVTLIAREETKKGIKEIKQFLSEQSNLKQKPLKWQEILKFCTEHYLRIQEMNTYPISINPNSHLSVLALSFLQLLTLLILPPPGNTLYSFGFHDATCSWFSLCLLGLSAPFADTLSFTSPFKLVLTQGSLLDHFIFLLRHSPLLRGFSYNSGTHDSHIDSSWAKL